MTRIVALSDTHMTRPQIPDGDILIHAGDLCSYGHSKEFVSEIRWLGSRPHRLKLFTPGNHERCVESNIEKARDICEANGVVMVINDAVTTLCGLEIYMSPMTPIFCNWAFMHSEDDAFELWRKLEHCDILVTHGPPRSIFDSCPLPQGCRSLWAAVVRTRPRVHLFGHIHEGFACRKDLKWETGDKTLFANVSVLDGAYKPVTGPFVFDIEKDANGKIVLDYDPEFNYSPFKFN